MKCLICGNNDGAIILCPNCGRPYPLRMDWFNIVLSLIFTFALLGLTLLYRQHS